MKFYKPTTPGRRQMTGSDFSDLTRGRKPTKKLAAGLKQKAGRDRLGHISIRHRGGGHKRTYRLIDFRQDKFDIPGRVASIEYDPNRTAWIALIHYADGEKRYILAPQRIKAGDMVLASQKKIEARVGNRMPLAEIPDASPVHNLELNPGRGGQIVRAAGGSAILMGKEGKYAQIKLPSGEIRNILKTCLASMGSLSNPEHDNINIGKAGRTRWLGIRPTVRGKAMNPVDHPHGGGEGNQPIGLKYPKTPWGRPALGVKTRRKKKYSDRLIVKRRR
ncbi:MAG: 50S ribosomal protein L2 [Patescibacteria group bacterium]|nr:50S ribosomal protein L2 [Patescibacteria group bacterium]